MTESALGIVQNMSDAQAVRFLQHFGNSLFKETSRNTILGGASPEIDALSAIKQLKALHEAEAAYLTLGTTRRVGRSGGHQLK